MISPLPTSEDFPYATLPSLFKLDLCKFKFLVLFSHLLALEHMVPLYSSLHLANLYLPFESQLNWNPLLSSLPWITSLSDTPPTLSAAWCSLNDCLRWSVWSVRFPINFKLQEDRYHVERLFCCPSHWLECLEHIK